MAVIRQRKKKLKRPKGSAEKPLLSILWFPAALLLVIGCCIPTVLRMLNSKELSISFYTLEEEKITSDVRIALISDLHLQEFGADNFQLVAAIRDLEPDIIAICGDMTEAQHTENTRVITLCRQLVALAPVYYAYGNREFHDILFEGSTLYQDLSSIGVHVLSDAYQTVQVNENRIDLGGLSEDPTQYAQYGKSFIDDFVTSPNTRVLLTHNPGHYDLRYQYEGAGCLIGTDIDVALCGHRHGGQVIITAIGGLYHPDVGLFPDFTQGVTQVEKTSVVVSRGLGGDSRLPRINNPPEIVMVILR